MKHQKLQTTSEISKRMANVKLKKGTAETMVAKALWNKGIRYRRNYKRLPGSPDIAITKFKLAIFIDGEFWHGEDWENRKTKLKSNRDYWIEKIEENMARDRKNDNLLQVDGWTVIHFWEKDIKKNIDICVEKIMETINYISS